jgi:hypothetical protein
MSQQPQLTVSRFDNEPTFNDLRIETLGYGANAKMLFPKGRIRVTMTGESS